jgi:hypothetical protein
MRKERLMTTDFTSIKSDLREIPALFQADEASVTRKSEWHRILAAATHSSWGSFQTAALCASVLVISLFCLTASATNLKPDTLKAWEEYVAAANDQMQERLRPDHAFLSSDGDPDRSAKLRGGEIMACPAGPHIPKRVPSGLIHDWNGEAFIPNATLHDVLPVLRDYGRYKEVYKPVVVDSKAIATGESEDQFSMLLMNKSLISKTALDSDFQSSYFRVSDRRWYSLSKATRIREIADYGSGRQHTLPEDNGAGLIWRIYSITRFEERDGGVYIEVEAIVLSRDIPVSLRWMVDPIVRRVSRESIITSIRQTKDAVRSSTEFRDRYAASGTCSNERNCVATSMGIH